MKKKKKKRSHSIVEMKSPISAVGAAPSRKEGAILL